LVRLQAVTSKLTLPFQANQRLQKTNIKTIVFHNNYIKVNFVMNLVSADLLTNHMVNFRINQEFPWTLLNWVTYDLST